MRKVTRESVATDEDGNQFCIASLFPNHRIDMSTSSTLLLCKTSLQLKGRNMKHLNSATALLAQMTWNHDTLICLTENNRFIVNTRKSLKGWQRCQQRQRKTKILLISITHNLSLSPALRLYSCSPRNIAWMLWNSWKERNRKAV